MSPESLNLAIERIETLAQTLFELSRAAEVRKLKGLAKEVRATLQRCFVGVEAFKAGEESVDVPWSRALFALENALEREIERCREAKSGAGEGLRYFEMVRLRPHDAFTIRAFRRERFIGHSAIIAQDHADRRQARIDAFLAVLGAQELDDTKHKVSAYRGEMLEGSWDRNLITRKKPTS